MVPSLPAGDRQIRTIGFDDAPHTRDAKTVSVAGVVCSGARFEGMVWGMAAKDGWDATAVLGGMLSGSKYASQVHAVLVDGIAVGGLNVVDLPELAARLAVPCIAVMRRQPDLEGMKRAVLRLPYPERRLAVLARAGQIHAEPPFFFQVHGAPPEYASEVLRRSTDTGHVPEPLRLAHLIGSAVIDGESRGRA